MNSYRAGFVGLIGQPNAGKSTLMNFLVDQKVSIVTAKPQTTRRRVMGIWNSKEGQIVFVDSPGLIQADRGLNGFLAQEAEDVIKNSDILLAVVSVDEAKAEDAQKVIDLVSSQKKPWIGLITKTDLQEKAHRVLILKDLITKKGGKEFSISTLEKSEDTQMTRAALLKEVLNMLPESPSPLYDVELFTPESTRNLAAEIVREKCFEHLHHELPYSLAVRVLLFDETTRSVPHLGIEIVVSKQSHKGMVIGKEGSVLKKIGSESRKEIEKIMGEKIFLDLKVSCREDWFSNQRMMKELGYVVAESKD